MPGNNCTQNTIDSRALIGGGTLNCRTGCSGIVGTWIFTARTSVHQKTGLQGKEATCMIPAEYHTLRLRKLYRDNCDYSYVPREGLARLFDVRKPAFETREDIMYLSPNLNHYSLITT